MVSQPEFGLDQFQLHDCEVPMIVADQVHSTVCWCGRTRGHRTLGEFDLFVRRFMLMHRSSAVVLDAEVAGLGNFLHRVGEAAVEEHERVFAVTHHAV